MSKNAEKKVEQAMSEESNNKTEPKMTIDFKLKMPEVIADLSQQQEAAMFFIACGRAKSQTSEELKSIFENANYKIDESGNPCFSAEISSEVVRFPSPEVMHHLEELWNDTLKQLVSNQGVIAYSIK